MTQLKDKLTEYLVAEAAKAQKNGASLTAVFKKTGEKFSLATGSVRNYYYSLIKKARTDDELKQKYPFISSLNARKKRRFTLEEEQELIKNVKDGVKNGKSAARHNGIGNELLAQQPPSHQIAHRIHHKSRHSGRDTQPVV